MICKARDKHEHPAHDKLSEAGAKAEEEMAFYLKRAFRDDSEAWVFNDLRYETEDDDAAQIDHLVLHRSGFILIESKSVTSKVRIHQNGEWERLWNNHWQGMPSPIKQVERQVEFLRTALEAYRDQYQLLGKMFFGHMQMKFRNVPFETLVAISDSGSIDRKGDFPQVTKADLVPDRVRDIIKRHKKARSLLSLNLDFKSNDGIFNFKDEEIESIRRWLTGYHCPQAKANAPVRQGSPLPQPPIAIQPPAIPAVPVAQDIRSMAPPATGLSICQKCGAQCKILWGKFGYYWKCPECQTNMPIKEYCPNCKAKMKLRKDKLRFFKYCEPCKTPESLYFEAKG
jgi:hypothetical protein